MRFLCPCGYVGFEGGGCGCWGLGRGGVFFFCSFRCPCAAGVSMLGLGGAWGAGVVAWCFPPSRSGHLCVQAAPPSFLFVDPLYVLFFPGGPGLVGLVAGGWDGGAQVGCLRAFSCVVCAWVAELLVSVFFCCCVVGWVGTGTCLFMAPPISPHQPPTWPLGLF